jgi:hypothetical protein
MKKITLLIRLGQTQKMILIEQSCMDLSNE